MLAMDRLAEELRSLADSNWLSEVDQQLLIKAALQLEKRPLWRRIASNLWCSNHFQKD